MQSQSTSSYHTTNTNQKPTRESPVFEPFSLPFSSSPAGGLIYIEQFQKNDGCNTPRRPWMMATNKLTGQGLFFQPTCKKWGCPACARVNANRWIARGLNGVTELLAAGHKVDFVTLTPHEKLSPEQSFYVLPRAWKTLHARYKYEIPASDPGAYFAVPERHKSGKIHAHMMVTGGLKKKWWKDNARECGMGYQSDVQEVETLGVGIYVGKYLGKTLDEPWPKNKRRVNTSRSWPVLPDMPQKEGWEFSVHRSDQELSLILEIYTGLGFTVFGVTTANAWSLLEDLSPVQQEVQNEKQS